MTLKEAREAAARYGCKLTKSEENEYRVSYAETDDEASAYYTSDLEDAVGTARLMSSERDSELNSTHGA